jgi:proline dehydrogenase
MVRTALLAAARSERCRAMIEDMRPTKQLVARFVAGTDVAHAIATSSVLAVDREVTLDLLGESTVDIERADATVAAYTRLLHVLDRTGLTSRVEISLKLSAIGGSLAKDGKQIALANARRISEAARTVGTTVTVDMEDHTTTDLTLETVRELRADFPWVGAVLQAYLHRTEGDARDLAVAGSRVRLCKGAYREPASVAYQDKEEVDRNYVRVMRILMEGDGYPMIASHDPRIISIAGELGAGRDFEYQMLYGIRPQEQETIARRGDTMRVYVPYGVQWYGYFMRRLAERPANLAFFLRAMATRR